MFRVSCFSDEIAPALKDQIRVIKDLGMKYLEIRTVDDIGVLDLDDLKLETIKKTCDSEGLTITCVSSPIGKDRVDVDLGTCVAQTKRACHAADVFGCKYIRVFSFFKKEIDAETAFNMSKERLSAISDVASEHGKVLVMEGGKDTVGETAFVARKLFNSVSNVSLKCAFDMAALLAAGDSPYEKSLPVLRDEIRYVHIKDMKIGATNRVPAGEGDAKVSEILDALRNEDLTISLEPHLAYAGAKRGFSGEENFRKAHSALIGILTKLGISYT